MADSFALKKLNSTSSFNTQIKRLLRKVLKPLNPPDKSGQALKETFAKSLIISSSPFIPYP